MDVNERPKIKTLRLLSYIRPIFLCRHIVIALCECLTVLANNAIRRKILGRADVRPPIYGYLKPCIMYLCIVVLMAYFSSGFNFLIFLRFD